MNEIWIKRLIAGTKIWIEVPANRKPVIKQTLMEYVENNIITMEQYTNITKENYTQF